MGSDSMDMIVADAAKKAARRRAMHGMEDNAPLSKDIVKLIAMDIGKEVVAYIEVMYPQAIAATSSTFKLSVRNSIYNQIMAALEVNEEGAIIARLEDRKRFRRQWTAQYRKIRKMKPVEAE